MSKMVSPITTKGDLLLIRRWWNSPIALVTTACIINLLAIIIVALTLASRH